MPCLTGRDQIGWYVYSADPDQPNVKRIRRYPQADKTTFEKLPDS